MGALPYFGSAMLARVKQAIADNAMTPAVAQQEAERLAGERAQLIKSLETLKQSMEALGFEEDELEQGEAEVGFQIPREIFDNELEGFSQELHQLRLIIRAFSEAAGNPGERIELRQISTSDPLVFVLLAYGTVKLIGGAVSWCLDQWKKGEEIRVLRNNTANLAGVPEAQQLVDQFDTLIRGTIKASVREESERLARDSHADEPRKNELANHLEVALEGLLARIERGMTVELRFLPPPSVEAETEEGDEAAAEFQEMKDLQQRLVFPEPARDPLLQLTTLPDPPRSGPVRRAAVQTDPLDSATARRLVVCRVKEAEVTNEKSRATPIRAETHAARSIRSNKFLTPGPGPLAARGVTIWRSFGAFASAGREVCRSALSAV